MIFHLILFFVERCYKTIPDQPCMRNMDIFGEFEGTKHVNERVDYRNEDFQGIIYRCSLLYRNAYCGNGIRSESVNLSENAIILHDKFFKHCKTAIKIAELTRLHVNNQNGGSLDKVHKEIIRKACCSIMFFLIALECKMRRDYLNFTACPDEDMPDVIFKIYTIIIEDLKREYRKVKWIMQHNPEYGNDLTVPSQIRKTQGDTNLCKKLTDHDLSKLRKLEKIRKNQNLKAIIHTRGDKSIDIAIENVLQCKTESFANFVKLLAVHRFSYAETIQAFITKYRSANVDSEQKMDAVSQKIGCLKNATKTVKKGVLSRNLCKRLQRAKVLVPRVHHHNTRWAKNATLRKLRRYK